MCTDNRKIYPELGLFIYKIIDASGKTHQEIADIIGVELRTVNYFCTGQRKPNQINLLRLLKATNAKVEEIPF